MKLIDEVLPRGSYDNDLLKDALQLPASAALGQDEASTAYRARQRGNQPSALVLEAVAPDGYAARIRLLIAFAADGAVLGVRVTQHKETPGLGDYIEPKKDKNKQRPWITQFDGLNPTTIDAREWKVKKDGGRFDSVAGATVTPARRHQGGRQSRAVRRRQTASSFSRPNRKGLNYDDPRRIPPDRRQRRLAPEHQHRPDSRTVPRCWR